MKIDTMSGIFVCQWKGSRDFFLRDTHSLWHFFHNKKGRFVYFVTFFVRYLFKPTQCEKWLFCMNGAFFNIMERFSTGSCSALFIETRDWNWHSEWWAHEMDQLLQSSVKIALVLSFYSVAYTIYTVTPLKCTQN